MANDLKKKIDSLDSISFSMKFIYYIYVSPNIYNITRNKDSVLYNVYNKYQYSVINTKLQFLDEFIMIKSQIHLIYNVLSFS
jgi:hypothetical protein